MPQQTFKVTLQRKVADIEQQAIVLVTANSKKKAGEIAVGRADEDESKVEWLPVLADGLTANEDTDVDILSVETTDELPAEAKPKDESGMTKEPADSRRGEKLEGGSQGGPDGGSAPPGTGSGLAHVPNLPDGQLGTQGMRVTGTGVMEQPSLEQKEAERNAPQPDKPKPRATSAAELAAPPGCGTVKAALNNPIPREGATDGRVLDVNSAEAEPPADTGAEPEGARDLATEHNAG